MLSTLRQGRKASRRRGLTLVELLVVLIIAGILGAIGVPRFIQAIRGTEESTVALTAQSLDREIRGLASFGLAQDSQTTSDGSEYFGKMMDIEYSVADGFYTGGVRDTLDNADTGTSDDFYVREEGTVGGEADLPEGLGARAFTDGTTYTSPNFDVALAVVDFVEVFSDNNDTYACIQLEDQEPNSPSEVRKGTCEDAFGMDTTVYAEYIFPTS